MDLEAMKFIMGAPATIIACVTALGVVGKWIYGKFRKESRKASNSDILEKKIDELMGQMTPLREEVKQLESTMGDLKGSTVCQLRSSITRIYFQYVNETTIPFYEHENLRLLYDEYVNVFDGNHYVKTIAPIILAKPVSGSPNVEE